MDKNKNSSFSRTVSMLIAIIGISVAAVAVTKILIHKKRAAMEERLAPENSVKPEIQQEKKSAPPAPVDIPKKEKKKKREGFTGSFSNKDLPNQTSPPAKPVNQKEKPYPKIDDEKDRIRYNLGRIEKFLEKKNYKKALELLENLKVKKPLYRLYLGAAQYSQRRFTQAIGNLRAGLSVPQKKNDRFIGQKYLSLSYYELNKLEESLTYAEKALKLKKDRQLEWIKNKIGRENRVMKRYGDAASEHFNIVFSKEEHDEIRLWIRDILEEAYKEVGKGLGYHPDSSVTVILYNQKDFFDVTRAPGWAGGLYDGKIRLPIRGLTKVTPNLKRIIVHEYTHALVHKITLKCPLWLNEGLAEYFSLGDVQTIPQYHPLYKLEKRFPSHTSQSISISYRQSYSAVKRLEERFGMSRIKDLLDKLSEGTAFPEAFEDVFYISYRKFMKDWWEEDRPQQ